MIFSFEEIETEIFEEFQSYQEVLDAMIKIEIEAIQKIIDCQELPKKWLDDKEVKTW